MFGVGEARRLASIVERAVHADESWWPYRKRDEIAIGAVLTQNTSWRNVEKALENLRREGLDTFGAIAKARLPRLERLVRPSGFYRQKARYLKELSDFMVSLGNSWKGMGRDELRKALLGVRGIGKETADSILLYYFNVPSFVIDAYTMRIVERMFGARMGYEGLRTVFEQAFPPGGNTKLYKVLHARIVEFAKAYCRKRPLCRECPARRACLHYRNQNGRS